MSTIVEEKWEEILEFLRTEYDVISGFLPYVAAAVKSV